MTNEDAPNPLSEVIFAPESEDALRGQPASRWRIMPLAVTALAVLLVVALVTWQGLLPGVRVVAKPTPFPHALATTSLHSTVNYGTLTVNGQPYFERFFSGMRLFLFAPTTHLTLNAPPFPTLTCTLTAPHITVTGNGCQATPAGPDGLVNVMLPLTLADLPPDQEAAALQAAQATLSQAATTLGTPLTVPPGGYYATKPGVYQRATRAMQATVMFTANFAADCPQIGKAAPCQQFDLRFTTSQHPSLWGVDVAATFMWRFQAADGPTIAGPQVTTYLPLLLAYSEPNGWTGASYAPDGTPGTLAHAVMANLCDAVLADAETHLIPNEIAQDATFTKAGIAGCDSTLVIVATQQQAFSGGDAEIIIRFGVALAAYSYTQQVFPTLPVATAADIAAVDNQ